MEGAKALVAEGHELGNHTWSHPYDFSKGDDTSIGEKSIVLIQSSLRQQGARSAVLERPDTTCRKRLTAR